jgi:lipoprotein-anchoring transpeptidase ErfK/SrfK
MEQRVITGLRGRVVRTTVVTLAGAMLVSGCGGDSAGTGTPAASSTAVAVAGTSGAGSADPFSAGSAQRAVSLHGALVVRKEARTSSAVVRLPAATRLGSPRVLLVQGVVPGWVQVLLPTRPNGSTGWVDAADVRLETVHDLIKVDLGTRGMTLVVGNRILTRTKVAIGSPDDPTPTGRFFVTDRVRPPDPNGTYGAFALGLSAHSATLSEFGSGDGQIGIHGTNEPTSIGRAASHGCIRVPADVAPMLARIPLGTPVVIT